MSCAALTWGTICDDHVGKHLLWMSSHPSSKIVLTWPQGKGTTCPKSIASLLETWWEPAFFMNAEGTVWRIQSHHLLGYRAAMDQWRHAFPQRGRCPWGFSPGGLTALSWLALEQLCKATIPNIFSLAQLFSVRGWGSVLTVESINAETDRLTSFRIEHLHHLVQISLTPSSGSNIAHAH